MVLPTELNNIPIEIALPLAIIHLAIWVLLARAIIHEMYMWTVMR